MRSAKPLSHLEQLEVTGRFSVSLAQARTPESVLSTALEGAMALCTGFWGTVRLDEHRLHRVQPADLELPASKRAWLERGIAATLEAERAWCETQGDQTALGVPLHVAGCPVGVIAVIGADARAETLAQLDQWARGAAVWYARAREFRALQGLDDRRRRAQAVTVAALGNPDPREALRALVRGHAQVFGGRGGIRLVDADTGLLEWYALAVPASGTDLDTDPLEPPLHVGEGAIGTVAARGEGLLIEDYPNWPGALESYVRQGVKSIIAAPLKRAGQVTGVIFAESLYTTHGYTQADLEILEHAATLASTMLEQAQARVVSEHARREAERKNAMLETIHETNMALLGTEADLAKLLQGLLERSVQLLDAEVGGVYLIQGEEIALKAALGDELLPRAALGYGVSGWVALHGTPLVVDDYAASAYHNEAHPGVPWRAVVSVPLKGSGNRVLGALTIAHTARTAHFNGNRLEHLERLAALASLALEKTALLEAMRAAMARGEQRGHLLDALAQITLELVAYEDPARLLQRLTERTMALFGADAAVVYLLDDARETFTRVAWHGESPGEHGSFGKGLSGRVMQLEHGLIVDDYRVWDGRDIHPGERSQWQAAMGVPLREGTRVIGAFTVASTRQSTLFTTAELETLGRFAAVSSLALEKAKLLGHARAAQRAAVARLEQLSALDAVSLQLLAQREPSEVIESTLKLIVPLIGAVAGGYWRYFEDAGALELTQAQHVPPQLLGHRQAVKPGGIAERIIRTRGAVLVHDYQTWDERDPELPALYRAVILAPLVVGDSVLGLLALAHDQPGGFTQGDLETAQRFAALASVALENARLLQVARHAEARASDRSALLETLHQVNLELGDYVRLQPLLLSILERALAILQGHDGRLYLKNADGSARLVASIGGEPVDTVHANEGASGAVMHSGQALLVEDYRSWPGRYPSIRSGRWRSVVSVPLRRGTQVLGALTVVDTQVAGRFGPRDLEILERFAAASSMALEKAQLLEEARHAERAAEARAAQLEALYTASLELSGELEPQRLLHSILERATAFLGADAGGIFLNNAAGTHAVLAVGIGGKPPERVPLGEHTVGHVALTGEPMLVMDEAPNPTLDPQMQTRSLVCVPLKRAGRVVGALAVVDTNTPNRFHSGDLEVLQRFAALASVALENARLYAFERQNLRDAHVRLHITQAISRLRGVTETAQALVRVLALTLEYEHIAIFLRNANHLHLQAALGYDDPPLTLELNQGVAARVFKSGRSELVTDPARDPDWISASPKATSLVCVPLTNRDGVFGTLNIEGQVHKPMTSADLEMLEALSGAFSTALENATLHEQLERKAEELEVLTLEAEHAARHDPLTGLRNRRAFEEDLRNAFRWYHDDGLGFSLAVLDLAGFKAVNDSLGHAAGDEALKRIADVLRGDKHASRVAYRIGGDEFMLLIPDALDARALLGEISAGIRALTLPGGLQVLPNIGLASCPQDTTDPDRLQSLADKRMYAAKAAGRTLLEGEDVPRPNRRASDRATVLEPDSEPG